MAADEHLRLKDVPELRDPVLLAAFAGWNDAAQAATSALLALCRRPGVRRFGDILAEDFFVFTETRPTISLHGSGQRSLHWPANRFFACPMPEGDRDAVLLIGTEPQLRWHTFCRLVLDVADQVHASQLITLGGLLADVPHTLPPRLSGFASAPELLPELRRMDVSLSRYQGPTGIVGALHDAWARTDRSAYSLWGSVPHYISASPNPEVSLALLHGAMGLIGVDVPLDALETEVDGFRRQIDEAVNQNPEALEYVRQLEEQYGTGVPEEDTPDLLSDLEQFLRSNRPPDGDE